MAPPVTSAAEPANHFVAYQQNSIFAANTLNFGPVVRRRNDDAPCSLHGFTDERRDIFRSNGKDAFFDSGGADQAERLL